jgi:hypothetical protein
MKLRALLTVAATVLFYIAVSLVPDKKIAFGISILYIGAISRILNNIPFALVVSYIACVPLSIGKFIPIDLVSAEKLHIYGRPFGVSANLAITVRELICVSMTSLLIAQQIRRRTIYIPRNYLEWALVLYPVLVGVSTYFGSIRPDISWLHVGFYIEPYIVYMFMTYMVSRADYTVLLAVIVASVGLESALVLLQHLHGGPLGLIVENFPAFTPIETSSDPTTIVLRVGGTFAHANILAQYLIFFLCVMIPVLYDVSSLLVAPAIWSLYVGTFVLILTMSRSAWIAWIAGLSVFYFIQKYILHYKLSVHHGIRNMSLIALPVLLVSIWLLAVPRLLGSAHTLDVYGSGQSRQQLFSLAIQTIRTHPVFGVGLSMDVYYAILHARSLGTAAMILTDFPESVHNGLLWLLVQVGLVGFVPFVMIGVGILGRLRRHIMRGKTDRIYMAGILAGVFAWLVNGQLQPMVPDLTVLIILILCLEQSSGATVRYSS